MACYNIKSHKKTALHPLSRIPLAFLELSTLLLYVTFNFKLFVNNYFQLLTKAW